MTGRNRGFNLYFLSMLAMLLTGCASTKDPNDKLSTSLRVHLEALPHQIVSSQTIRIPRSNPVPIQVENLVLFTEENVVRARVVQEHGTHAIEIEFNNWAMPVLEHNSSSYQGRRLAFLAQWGQKGEYARWIGAPRMSRRIVNGVFTFSPDASLEETYQIVTGLNNSVHQTKKQLEW